jgi:hypothetical protein
MKMNFEIRRTFKINDREYRTLDEMPPDVRAAFEQSAAVGDEGIETRTDSRIVVNGVEYESTDEMPTFVRNLYEQAGKPGKGLLADRAARAAGRRPTAQEPSFSMRSLLVGIVLAALVYAIYIVLTG